MFMSSSGNKIIHAFLITTRKQMFLLVSVRHVGAHPGGHQHGVSIQISTNLVKTFLRVSRIRNILLAWILARNLVYLSPFVSQIPDFIHWTVLIFILIYFEWRDTYIERETQCFITRWNTEKRVGSTTRSGVFLANFGEFLWWWNIVSNVWYCLSKKMILEEEIKDFTSISKHLLNSNFHCIFFMNY